MIFFDPNAALQQARANPSEYVETNENREYQNTSEEIIEEFKNSNFPVEDWLVMYSGKKMEENY